MVGCRLTAVLSAVAKWEHGSERTRQTQPVPLSAFGCLAVLSSTNVSHMVPSADSLPPHMNASNSSQAQLEVWSASMPYHSMFHSHAQLSPSCRPDRTDCNTQPPFGGGLPMINRSSRYVMSRACSKFSMYAYTCWHIANISGSSSSRALFTSSPVVAHKAQSRSCP